MGLRKKGCFSDYVHIISDLNQPAPTPILQPVVKITELLRARTAMDYKPLVEEILSERDTLISLSRE